MTAIDFNELDAELSQAEDDRRKKLRTLVDIAVSEQARGVAPKKMSVTVAELSDALRELGMSREQFKAEAQQLAQYMHLKATEKDRAKQRKKMRAEYDAACGDNTIDKRAERRQQFHDEQVARDNLVHSLSNQLQAIDQEQAVLESLRRKYEGTDS